MPSSHPLDPLDPVELERAVSLVREHARLSDGDLFTFVALAEPSKAELAGHRLGQPIERRALVSVWRQSTRELFEAIASLSAGQVRSWILIEGAKAPMLARQVDRVVDVVKADAAFAAGLRARGFRDTSELHLEVWPFGGLLPDRFEGRRVAYTPAWERRHPDGNPYAHPVHGYYAVVDMDTLELLEIEEHDSVPIPDRSGDYRAASHPAMRTVSRLEITQPNGPGFRVDGHDVEWQNWRMRVGFCPREGLVLHDVRYVERGVERRIAHRLSMAELVIPYADPSPGSYRKNAFDVGEVHMGIHTNPLTLGCDCVGAIAYLDAHYADGFGAPQTIANATCLHEEDAGMLWKHTDTDGHVEVRRARRFVVSSVYTVDNYEYGYYWYFGQDGSIEFEGKFTGVVLTLARSRGTEARFGTEIAPGLIAPHHQHVFCARLDLDIDGAVNTVVEVDAVAPPRGPLNPYGGSFIEKEHVITVESESRRHIEPARARYWKVTNPASLNGMGRPVAYKLVPRHAVTPVAEPTSSIGRRAGFMYADLWVTAYDEAEKYPAGDYPFQSERAGGLPGWTEAGRGLEAADVVLWHVFGITHVPRLEDWPVMPVDRAGFVLAPFGFFDRNPSLDVPPPVEECVPHDHHAHGHTG